MEEVLKTRLKLFCDNVKSLIDSGQSILQQINDNSVDIDNAEIIKCKLQSSIDRFVSEIYNYFKLVEIPSADDIAVYTQVQISGEELVAELKSKLVSKTQSGSNGDKINVTSKLPKMELGKFSGDVLKWHQFWDQFSSNVDSRNICDVDKLLYLQSVLHGEAKRAIEGLDTTNKNYQIAVSTLKERYGKPGTIIDAHYAALYRIKMASKSVADCRRVFNEIEGHLRVLSSLGEDVNHNHLRVTIMQKFSEDFIYELRMKMGSESDTIANIRRHLEQIISARELSSRLRDEIFDRDQPSTSKSEGDRFTLETLHVRSNNPIVQKNVYPARDRYHNDKENLRRSIGKGLFDKNRNNYNSKGRYDDCRKRQHSKDDDRKEIGFKRRKVTCVFCGKSHFNDECTEFSSIQERKKRLEGRCYNCLAKGHMSKQCKSKMKCYHCSKYGVHNRSLCPSKQAVKVDTLHVSDPNGNRGMTVLQTATVQVNKIGCDTDTLNCRIILDCGSQRTYITKSLARKLALPVLEVNNLSVFTFGADKPNDIESPVVVFELITRTKHRQTFYANVVPHITNSVPSLSQNAIGQIENLPNLSNIVLADTYQGDQVDILLGNDYYFSAIKGEKLQITDNLYLVDSIFGWIWSGCYSGDNYRNSDRLSVLTYFQSNVECSSFCEPDLPLRMDSMKKLWDLESIGITDSPKASRDDEAVRQFNESTKFFGDRYHVKWPWIEYPPEIPSNFGLAYGRLIGLLKRLDSDTVQSYDKIIQEQLSLGIIEVVAEPTRSVEHPVHYLPHHCVRQSDKLRLVYDASAKVKGNKSLNECLYRGPLMLEDLTGLLIRFREHKIGIVADVEKAFLQIGLQDEDRDVTRFLWLKHFKNGTNKENIIHFRFCRVPFGVISSPFLLNATIRYHLQKRNRNIYKQIAEDLYVDNLVTGAGSSDDAERIFCKAKSAFMDLSMNLRQWNSNSSQFKERIPEQFRDSQQKTMKVLGLDWNLCSDGLGLRFCPKDTELSKVDTKRDVLRLVASVFDPCGLAVPLILPAKLFLQDLWNQKVDWDIKLSDQNMEECKNVLRSLKSIKNVNVCRYFCTNIDHKLRDRQPSYELHAFTDASLQAYAAAIYLRCICGTDIAVSFVIGKSRLVCKKEQSNLQIPKLELLGVLIGSRLIKYVHKTLRININNIYLWTDSLIVASWCRSEKLLPPFVSRRVEEIKKGIKILIRYVPSEVNPADVATRPNASMDSVNRWLKGPDFLYNNSTLWPPNADSNTDILTVTQSIFCGQDLSDQEAPQILDEDIQSDEAQPICSEKTTLDDLELIRQVQRECYAKELEGKVTDVVRSLDVYKDQEGFLRCKGRLGNTNWPDEQKYPILLPRGHVLTSKIINDIHSKNYHVGASHTLSLLRKKYWVPRGRMEVQKVIKQCASCRKYDGGPYKLPAMAALPSERVTYSDPFTYSGTDYFGPISIDVKGTIEKRWICLYTCLAVRAIHLEVVNDLTSEECLLALRRFISTRKVPEFIISDNALQFKLTADVLTNGYCITNGIKWRFIPELAPWFGGFYERLIGIIKNCLKKTLDKHLLNQTQLNTIVKEVEAVVNSRPLTVVGPELEHVLTPADFLHPSGPTHFIPSNNEFLETATSTKSNLIEGWKRGQQILKEYVEMFCNQYLTSLRERRSRNRQPRVVVDAIPKVGDIVQVKSDAGRARWKVGQISAIIKGKDGKVRVAKVCISANETLTRSISHLYPLEIVDDEENQCQSQQPDSAQNFRELTQPANSEIGTQATCGSTESAPNILQDAQSRPRRLAAEKARSKVKQWTSQLYNMFRSP